VKQSGAGLTEGTESFESDTTVPFFSCAVVQASLQLFARFPAALMDQTRR